MSSTEEMEFAAYVIKMLDTQQQYFKTKALPYLMESKELERKVRKMAMAILNRQEKLL